MCPLNFWFSLVGCQCSVPLFFFTESLFLDESGIVDRSLLRTRQRGPRGKRSSRKVPKVQNKRLSILPAIGVTGLVALSVLEGSVNRKRFEGFLEHQLVRGRLPDF